MVGGLNEPNSGDTTCALAFECGLHQRPADPVIHRRRVDGHRTDSGDRRALIDERAADHLVLPFGHQADEPVAREPVRDYEAPELARGHLDREVVSGGDRFERVVDSAA